MDTALVKPNTDDVGSLNVVGLVVKKRQLTEITSTDSVHMRTEGTVGVFAAGQ